MYFNPFLAQQLAGERVEDALREAEQYRLVRAIRGPGKTKARRMPSALIPGLLPSLAVWGRIGWDAVMHCTRR